MIKQHILLLTLIGKATLFLAFLYYQGNDSIPLPNRQADVSCVPILPGQRSLRSYAANTTLRSYTLEVTSSLSAHNAKVRLPVRPHRHNNNRCRALVLVK